MVWATGDQWKRYIRCNPFWSPDFGLGIRVTLTSEFLEQPKHLDPLKLADVCLLFFWILDFWCGSPFSNWGRSNIKNLGSWFALQVFEPYGVGNVRVQHRSRPSVGVFQECGGMIWSFQNWWGGLIQAVTGLRFCDRCDLGYIGCRFFQIRSCCFRNRKNQPRPILWKRSETSHMDVLEDRVAQSVHWFNHRVPYQNCTFFFW